MANNRRTQYVEGFIFSPCLNYVLLIRKNRPPRFKGLLNGIGGKVEPTDLCDLDAMVRECEEECALQIPRSDWTHFARYGNSGAEIAFYATVLTSKEALDKHVSLTDELVDVYLWRALSDSEMIYNVKWLLQMAVSVIKTGHHIYLVEEYDKGFSL